jgi:hypothetical protein
MQLLLDSQTNKNHLFDPWFNVQTGDEYHSMAMDTGDGIFDGNGWGEQFDGNGKALIPMSRIWKLSERWGEKASIPSFCIW